VYPANAAKTLAENFDGVPFLRPNDLVVDKKGGVYFTDSGQGRNPDGTPSNVPPRPAVYYITPAGKLQRLANDIGRPNGIQLSPDEKTLYVANTVGEYVLAFDVAADGAVSGRRNFARLAGFNAAGENGPTSGADGLAVDGKGRLYVASTAGIQVFDARGGALGVIPVPKAPQNLAFAGPDKKTLYVVGRGSAWRIATETAGYSGRAK
jgi:gluconolactonase